MNPRSRRRESAHLFAFEAKDSTHVGGYGSGVQRANRLGAISPREERAKSKRKLTENGRPALP